MATCKLQILNIFSEKEKCAFCRTQLVDNISFGPIYKYDCIITHYFCMLLSSQITQYGRDKDGILGFLKKDIQKELVRGARLKCTFCKKNGATIGCAIRSCRVNFHLPCGIANQSMSLFYDAYESFCRNHKIHQNIPLERRSLSEGTVCLICLLDISFSNGIWAPCCETALYHKRCIQEVAINAGYYFRCPNCNNAKKFRKSMLELGIYIPDQDASWELEPNAYSSLNHRYNHCDADICYYSKGRDASQPDGIWRIILCYRCLRKGVHMKCGKIDADEQWTCSNSQCLNDSILVKQTSMKFIGNASRKKSVETSVISTETMNSCNLVIQYDNSCLLCNDDDKFVLSKGSLLERGRFPISHEIQENSSNTSMVDNSSEIGDSYSNSNTIPKMKSPSPKIRNLCDLNNASMKKPLQNKSNTSCKLNFSCRRRKKYSKPLWNRRKLSRKCQLKKLLTGGPCGRRNSYIISKESVRVFPPVFHSLKRIEILL